MTEAQEQAALIRWTADPQSLILHPELHLLFHIPNGGKRNPAEARHLKQMGVKAGVPDLCLPVARHGFHSLWIELKTKKGRTSEAQDGWLKELAQQGHAVYICRGWADAAYTISSYLSDKPLPVTVA